MSSGEHFEYEYFEMKIFNLKIEIFQIIPHANDHIQNALLNSFLVRFGQIIACWKGLELRNSDSLLVITLRKALHVIAYKMQNIVHSNSSTS
jgi:hypothetical protein